MHDDCPCPGCSSHRRVRVSPVKLLTAEEYQDLLSRSVERPLVPPLMVDLDSPPSFMGVEGRICSDSSFNNVFKFSDRVPAITCGSHELEEPLPSMWYSALRFCPGGGLREKPFDFALGVIPADPTVTSELGPAVTLVTPPAQFGDGLGGMDVVVPTPFFPDTVVLDIIQRLYPSVLGMDLHLSNVIAYYRCSKNLFIYLFIY